jgi:two-component system phosphate regulon sensor histidine kinase PhoR
VIDLAIKQLEWQMLQSKVNIIKDIPKDLPFIIGDFNELSQVISNILSNAIKYGGKDKSITIRAGLTEEIPRNLSFKQGIEQMIYISIIDQGEGIPKEHIDRLTERFYRIEQSRSKKTGGTGLGLAIVKQILLRHKGTLDIKSSSKGSTFTIYLPALHEDDIKQTI